MFERQSTKSREEEHLILSEIGDLQSKLKLNKSPKTFEDGNGYNVDNETDSKNDIVINFHRLASRSELRDVFHSVPQEKLHQKFNHIVPENGPEIIQGRIYDLKKKKDIIDYKKENLILKLGNLKEQLISNEKKFIVKRDSQRICCIESGIAEFETKKTILQNLEYLYKTIIEKLQDDINNYPLRLRELDSKVKKNEETNKSLNYKLKKMRARAKYSEKTLQSYKKGLKSDIRHKSVCFMNLKNKQPNQSEIKGEVLSRCSVRSVTSVTSNYSRSLQNKIDSLNPEKRNQKTLLMQRNILSMCKEIAILQNQAARLGQVAKVKVTDPEMFANWFVEFQLRLNETQNKSAELLKDKKKKEKTLKNLHEELIRLKLSTYDKTNQKILNTRKAIDLIKKKTRQQKQELAEKKESYSRVSQIYENLIWKIFSISGINVTIEKAVFFDKFSEDPLRLIELIKGEYTKRYTSCTSINNVLESILNEMYNVQVYVDTKITFDEVNSKKTELKIELEKINDDLDEESDVDMLTLTITKQLIYKHKKKNFKLNKVDKDKTMKFISSLDGDEKQQIISEIFLYLFKMDYITMDFANRRILASFGQLVSLEYLERCKQINDSTTDDPSYLSAKDIKLMGSYLRDNAQKK